MAEAAKELVVGLDEYEGAEGRRVSRSSWLAETSLHELFRLEAERASFLIQKESSGPSQFGANGKGRVRPE